ncbi:MAG TPA: hypothetical protein VJ965_04450 [Anaerolineales bacterium]|nr:hypothetical protein [Anaerolineales bacterium]
MKLSTRELVTIAVFGTLWGIVEMTLGGVLKSLDIPMSGMFLAAVGLTVAMVGRVFVPKRGATIFIGVIAMLLKLFSLGGVILGPMVGIFTEALVAELVLSTRKKPNQIILMLAGALGVVWVIAQPFVTGPLLFGRTFFVVWLDFLDTARRVLGLGDSALVLVLGLYILIHLVVGVLAGVLAWNVGKQVRSRLGKSSEKIVEL